MDNEIFHYVSKKTVDLLRAQYKNNNLPGDAEYFTYVQDFDEADWQAHMFVPPAIMLDGVALMPVTFGSTTKRPTSPFYANRMESGKSPRLSIPRTMSNISP
jgi:hypothetical protein